MRESIMHGKGTCGHATLWNWSHAKDSTDTDTGHRGLDSINDGIFGSEFDSDYRTEYTYRVVVNQSEATLVVVVW